MVPDFVRRIRTTYTKLGTGVLDHPVHLNVKQANWNRTIWQCCCTWVSALPAKCQFWLFMNERSLQERHVFFGSWIYSSISEKKWRLLSRHRLVDISSRLTRSWIFCDLVKKKCPSTYTECTDGDFNCSQFLVDQSGKWKKVQDSVLIEVLSHWT